MSNRRRVRDEPPLADGEHRPHGAVQVIRDARGLVENKKIDTAEVSDSLFSTGQTDDTAAVRQFELELRLVLRRDRPAERVVAVKHLAEEFPALPLRRRQQ
jgi:hypothetical protein